MLASRGALVIMAAAAGALAAPIAGSAIAPRAAPAASEKKTTATLTLSGRDGRYVRFSGTEAGFLEFDGSMTLIRPVRTGSYVLSLVLRTPAGSTKKVTYDIKARQR